MAATNVTAQLVRDRLDYDPLTGALVWRKRVGRVSAGDAVRAKTIFGHLVARINGRNYLAHRLAWLHYYGTWPEHEIDHIDGNPSNNAVANLRDVPHGMNMQNMRAAQSHNKGSKLVGAHWHRAGRRWRSNITAEGKTVHLGYFDTEQQAHDAYIAAKRVMHPGCTI